MAACGRGLSVCTWLPLVGGIILIGKYGSPDDTQSKRLDTVRPKTLDECSPAIAQDVSDAASPFGQQSVQVALN